MSFKRTRNYLQTSVSKLSTGVGVLALTLLSPVYSAPEAEVIHWWKTGGDRKAVDVLVDEFSRNGGSWYDESTDTFNSTRESALNRMAKGYAPTAIQWNAGTEIIQFAELGLLNAIDDPAEIEKFRSLYNPTLFRTIFHNDTIIALPVNIHGENWFWKNSAHFDAIASGSVETWDQFVEIAEQLDSKGIVPLAVGVDAWQQRILFNSVVLGYAGPTGYHSFLEADDLSIVDTADFSQALQTFINLSDYSKSFDSGSWQDQVQAVSDGRAAGMFMGDWAKGEFLNLGAKPGEKIDCELAPGTLEYIQPVFDVFLLGKVESEEEQAGQSLFKQVLQNKDVNSEFNRIKGSVPPFKEVSENQVDHCGKKVISILKSDQGIVKPFASFSDGEFHSSLQVAINKIWTGDGMTLETARQLIRGALQTEKNRRLQEDRKVSDSGN